MADPSRTSLETSLRDVLVLAPNWLGDVVMATPLLNWLAGRTPSSGMGSVRVHLGIRRAWAPLFEGDPRLSSLIPIERNGRHAGLAGILRQASLLNKGEFDAVILCPPSLRSALVAALARIPRRVGYRTDGRSGLLTDGLPALPRGTHHFAREMLELGSALMGEGDPPLDVPVPSLPACETIVPADLPAGPPAIAFAPGTTYGEAKTWPIERGADFLKAALEDDAHRVVLLGDGNARPLAEDLATRVGRAAATGLEAGAPLTDLTGRTDLPRVAAVLKSCAGFVGNDSGLMHLAAALGVPTVGIFGSSNPDWTAPLGKCAAAVAAEGYDCRPCYRKTCNQPRFCLEDIPGPMVMAELAGLISARGEGESS